MNMKMNMEKIILTFSFFILIATANIVFADDLSDEAQKFYDRICTRPRLRGLNAFICDLSDRIHNLPPGPPGPQGEQGIPGPIGPSLKVYDALNNQVGFLLDHESDSPPRERFFDSRINKIVTVGLHTGEVVSGDTSASQLWFTSTDCSGTPYVNAVFNPYQLAVRVDTSGNKSLYGSSSYSDIGPITAHSSLEQDNTCRTPAIFPSLGPGVNFGSAGAVQRFEFNGYAGPMQVRGE